MAFSATEQYMLELVNRARLDPQAEADRYGLNDLSRGLSTTITAEAKQVLAPNDFLRQSSEDHSEWMLDNNVFSHTGAGGSSASQRMQAAGYTLTGAWGTGENLSWTGTTRHAEPERRHRKPARGPLPQRRPPQEPLERQLPRGRHRAGRGPVHQRRHHLQRLDGDAELRLFRHRLLPDRRGLRGRERQCLLRHRRGARGRELRHRRQCDGDDGGGRLRAEASGLQRHRHGDGRRPEHAGRGRFHPGQRQAGRGADRHRTGAGALDLAKHDAALGGGGRRGPSGRRRS